MATVKIKSKGWKRRQLDEKKCLTIRQVYQSFMIAQKERGNSKATLDFYSRCYKKLAAVTEDGEEYADVLVREGFQTYFIESLGKVNQQTVNSYLRGYRAFGRFCEEKGYISGFSCPIKEVEPELKQVYTHKELAALLVKPPIEQFEQYRNYTIIVLLLATGARANTIINLKISDVDLDEGYIVFNRTKNNKVVRIGLERKAQRDIREYILYWRKGEGIRPDDYLFCNAYGEQFTRSGLSKAIASYNVKRGVMKTSLHLFRHTFAKNWITSGGDIISLARILTHSELEMVKRYANLYSTDIKDKIDKHSALSQVRIGSGKTLKSMKRNDDF